MKKPIKSKPPTRSTASKRPSITELRGQISDARSMNSYYRDRLSARDEQIRLLDTVLDGQEQIINGIRKVLRQVAPAVRLPSLDDDDVPF